MGLNRESSSALPITISKKRAQSASVLLEVRGDEEKAAREVNSRHDRVGPQLLSKLLWTEVSDATPQAGFPALPQRVPGDENGVRVAGVREVGLGFGGRVVEMGGEDVEAEERMLGRGDGGRHAVQNEGPMRPTSSTSDE